MQLLLREISDYSEVSVYETTQLYGENGKFRCLQFSDHAVQGAMDLKDPKRIVLEYPRAIIHLMEANHSEFHRVFVIGHGIGTIAEHYPDKSFTVAEVDLLVVELSRQYFGYSYDNVLIGDGRQLLSTQESHAWDYVILDAFNPKGTPVHLLSLEFFSMVMEKLTSRGLFILNLMGKARHDKLINAVHTTLQETVAYVKAFVLPGNKKTDLHNILLVGGNRAIDYKLSGMAGFKELDVGQGHTIRD